jgi:predicted acylesterase/phospholipase RssA
MTKEPDAVLKAREFLKKKPADVKEAIGVAKDVAAIERFDFAVAVLEHVQPASTEPLYTKWAERSALYLSKDRDIPVLERHERALALLTTHARLTSTDSAETLGIAGGICKRWWQADGQRSHLDDSLRYYTRGHLGGKDGDGYAGINTAYLLDLLTSLDPEPALPELMDERERRFEAAARIRMEVLEKLDRWGGDRHWWYYATRAEARLALGDLSIAVEELTRGLSAAPPPSELTTTVQQLADLVRIRPPRMKHLAPEEIAAGIAGALKLPSYAFESAVRGKVGLALSGGGFRASLFHIGTLAALADAGLLRHVEVLSCVSGGSIVGAHYYLELRRMLQSGKGASDDDYVAIVEKIRTEFLSGVETNIRVRLAESLQANVRMTLDADYSRTERAGELYEEVLFSKTGEDVPMYLNALRIEPTEAWIGKEDGTEFHPKYHNWQLRSKVPILVLNATTLNTGHTWQFTTRYMGEPPLATAGTDAIERLRRFYYDEAPAAYRQFRLGRAVAASACVPGLFEPIVLRGLYPDRTVRLVDGGIHDNQGLATLMDEGCRVILVSDASGQMLADHAPAGGFISVPLRSDDILQARLREVQVEDLLGRRRSGALQGVVFVHLTKELDQNVVTWVGGEEKPLLAVAEETSYGIRKEIQQKLAEVRTDLDAFSECEALALMTSAYQMTAQSLTAANLPTLVGPAAAPPPASWPFLAIGPALGTPAPGSSDPHASVVSSLLGDSRRRFFRVWTQDPQLRKWRPYVKAGAIAALVAAALLLFAGTLLVGWWFVVAGLLAIALGIAVILTAQTPGKGLQETLVGTLLSLIGYPIAKLHGPFNRRFLDIGRWPPP